MQTPEYYERYTELVGLIYQGYTDYYILKEIDHYNEIVQEGKRALPQGSYMVLRHYCDLVKSDLGLLLWKVTDSDSQSNTVVTLGTYLAKTYKKQCGHPLSKKSKHIRDNELLEIRRKFLAHNDIQKSGTKIEVSTLFELLNDVKQTLNSMCFPDIDDRVKIIEDSQTYVIAYQFEIGLNWMIENSMISAETEEVAAEDA